MWLAIYSVCNKRYSRLPFLNSNRVSRVQMLIIQEYISANIYLTDKLWGNNEDIFEAIF